jgi:hypothetical protein
MTTLRQRFHDYRHTDGYPETPENFECSRRRKIAGSVIVATTGFVCSAPFAWGLLVAARNGFVPYPIAGVVGLSLYFIAGAFSKHVGGPVADHILQIPREVSE